jgi:hypothetical protein
MAEGTDGATTPSTAEESFLGKSAGGVERLPIEVQAISPPSDGHPSAAFMRAATPATSGSSSGTPARES